MNGKPELKVTGRSRSLARSFVRAGERGEGSSCRSHTLPVLGINRGAFVDAGPSEEPGLLSSSSPPQVRLVKVSVQGSGRLRLNAGQGLVVVKLSVFLEYVFQGKC